MSNVFTQMGMPKWAQVLFVVIVLFIAFMIFKPFTVINAGYTGVVVTMGSVSETPLAEGLRFKIPAPFQSIVQIDNRIQKLEVESESSSKDMQVVHIKLAVNYRINQKASASVYKNIGSEYQNIVVSPATLEVVKAVTAKDTAEQLITNRQEVSDGMKDLLVQKLQASGFDIQSINITNFAFSAGFNQAIEAKQTAQQLTLKSEQDLNRIKVEAQQKIEAAKAEAESLKLQKQEITPDLLRLREIEVQMKAVEKWDNKLPTTVILGSDGKIFNIPITGTATK